MSHIANASMVDKLRLAAAVVGFGLTWFFFRPGVLASLFVMWDPSLRFYSSWCIALLAVLTVLCLSLPLFSRLVRMVVGERLVALLVVEFSVVGYALLALAGHVPLPRVVAMLAAVVVSVGFTVLLFGWFDMLSRLEPKLAIAVLALSASVYALFEGFGADSEKTLLYVLAPSVSALLLFIARGFEGCRPVDGRDLAAGGPDSYLDAVRSVGKLELPLFCLFMLFLVSGRIVIGLSFNIEHSLPVGVMILRNVLIGVIAAFLIVYVYKTKDPQRFLTTTWAPVAVVFFMGQLVLIAFGDAQVQSGTATVSAALMGFEVLSYLLLLRLSNGAGSARMAVFGLGFVALRLVPLIVQRTVVPDIVALFDMPQELGLFVCMAVVLAVLSGVFLIFVRISEGRVVSAAQVSVAQPGTNKASACEELGVRAGLTAREVEILMLMLEGNTQKKIADELHLSYGTVQWYAKAIYRKFDVHSKQELVDLVRAQEEMAVQTGSLTL